MLKCSAASSPCGNGELACGTASSDHVLRATTRCGELAGGTGGVCGSSDHESRAWTGGSTGGNGGAACCCMMLGHVDTLVAEDVSAGEADTLVAEEANPGHEVAGEESFAGGNGSACGTCGGTTTATGRRGPAGGHGCGASLALLTFGGDGIVCEQ